MLSKYCDYLFKVSASLYNVPIKLQERNFLCIQKDVLGMLIDRAWFQKTKYHTYFYTVCTNSDYFIQTEVQDAGIQT